MFNHPLLKRTPFPDKTPDLKYRILWLSLGYSFVFTIVYFSLIPNPDINAQVSDKLIHFLAYGLLMGWFSQLYARYDYFKIALRLFLMGISLEVLQSFTDYRSIEFFDAVANSSGILIAWISSTFFPGRILLFLFKTK